jgi:hypothetical protein
VRPVASDTVNGRQPTGGSPSPRPCTRPCATPSTSTPSTARLSVCQTTTPGGSSRLIPVPKTTNRLAPRGGTPGSSTGAGAPPPRRSPGSRYTPPTRSRRRRGQPRRAPPRRNTFGPRFAVDVQSRDRPPGALDQPYSTGVPAPAGRRPSGIAGIRVHGGSAARVRLTLRSAAMEATIWMSPLSGRPPQVAPATTRCPGSGDAAPASCTRRTPAACTGGSAPPDGAESP